MYRKQANGTAAHLIVIGERDPAAWIEREMGSESKVGWTRIASAYTPAMLPWSPKRQAEYQLTIAMVGGAANAHATQFWEPLFADVDRRVVEAASSGLVTTVPREAVHQDPDHTTTAEGPTMVPLKQLSALIATLIELDRVAKRSPAAY